jgi:hypothetical protein
VNELPEIYHPWFPILHQPSLLEALQASIDVKETPYLPILKAIVAVTLDKDYRSDTPSKERCRQLSDDLRNQVVMEAVDNLSLRPLQAILILCIHEHGSGRLKEYWNLVALAKRYVSGCRREGFFVGVYILLIMH